MAAFVRGEIVVVPFPFSTGMDYKRRPAIVLASLPYGKGFDYLLCACSATRDAGEPNLLEFDETSVLPGGTWAGRSYIRPTTLFTIDGSQLVRSLGCLNLAKVDEVLKIVRSLLA